MEICNVLPAYHIVTSCDATSYPHIADKVKPFRKMMTEGKFHLLDSLWKEQLSIQDTENVLTFIRTVMYPGKDNKDYVETKIRMYEQQKVKSSLTLLPDRYRSAEHVKRANLRTYIWKPCLLKDTDHPNPEEFGWQVEDNSLVPLWFTSSQLPPSLCKKPSRSKHREEAE